MQNLLKNKLFIILFMFFAILFLKENFVSAATTYTLSDGSTITTTDELDSLINQRGRNDLLLLRNPSFNTATLLSYNSSEGSIFHVESSLSFQFRKSDTFDFVSKLDTYNLSLDETNTVTSFERVYFNESSSISLVSGESYFYYSTHDIYYFDEYNLIVKDLVFQQAPQSTQTPTNLVQIVEQAETEKTLAEILGIIPVVMVVIVGLLAIRKAIVFLMKILKRA